MSSTYQELSREMRNQREKNPGKTNKEYKILAEKELSYRASILVGKKPSVESDEEDVPRKNMQKAESPKAKKAESVGSDEEEAPPRKKEEPKRLYTGKEYNELTKDTKLCKFLSTDMTHHGFRYKVGLNVDTKPFNPSGSCKPGGLYFFCVENINKFYERYGPSVATVEIPDDAQVYVDPDGDKAKADKLIIKEIHSIEKHPFFSQVDICKKIINHRSANIIKLFDWRNDVFTSEMIKFMPSAIAYVTYETEEHTSLAISGFLREITQNKNDDDTEADEPIFNNEFKNFLRHINWYTAQNYFEMKKVKSDVLRLIPIQPEKFYLDILEVDGRDIVHIDNPTKKMYLTALKQNGHVIELIMDHATDEMYLEAVKQCPDAIKLVPKEKRSNEICMIGVKGNGANLKYVPRKMVTKELCDLALETSGKAIKFFTKRFKTSDAYSKAIEKDPYAIQFVPAINDKYEELFALALKKDINILRICPKIVPSIVKEVMKC